MMGPHSDVFNTAHRFKNRRDAGIRLSRMLEHYAGKDALVLGIAKGGVEVAYHVSKMIHGELSVVVSKKLPFPGHEEIAFGALSEDGSVYKAPLSAKLDRYTIDYVIQEQLKEIQHRIQKYRNGHPLPDMHKRIVIIVDDGIATGATIVPVLKLCRSKNPHRIVVAAPVSGNNYVSDITAMADDVKIMEQPDDFWAVSQMYEDFHNLSDAEVVFLLEEFKREMMLARKSA